MTSETMETISYPYMYSIYININSIIAMLLGCPYWCFQKFGGNKVSTVV